MPGSVAAWCPVRTRKINDAISLGDCGIGVRFAKAEWNSLQVWGACAVRVLLLNDTSTEDHWGSRLAGGEVKRWICEHRAVDSVITRSVGWSWKFAPVPEDLADLDRCSRSGAASVVEMRSLIAHVDFVVINAEGTLLGNRSAVRALLMAVRMAEMFGRPCAIMNATIEPLRNRGIREMMSACLPHVSTLCVREAESEIYLREMGIADVICASDAAFSALGYAEQTDQALEVMKPDRLPAVVVFGSVLFNDRDHAVVGKLRAFLLRLRQSMSEELILLSMCRGDGDAFAGLAGELGARNIASGDCSPYELFALLKRVSLCITGRYHGAVLSVAAGCPFVHFETHSGRIEWLSKRIGLSHNALHVLRDTHLDESVETTIRMLGPVGQKLRPVIQDAAEREIRRAKTQGAALDAFLQKGGPVLEVDDVSLRKLKVKPVWRYAVRTRLHRVLRAVVRRIPLPVRNVLKALGAGHVYRLLLCLAGVRVCRE